MFDLDVMFFQARMRMSQTVDARILDAKIKIRADAQSARRSIGQLASVRRAAKRGARD